MTTFAVKAELSIVCVIAAMTFATSAAELGYCGQGLAMTIRAVDIGVGAIKHEICLLVMVEAPFLPVHGAMA